MRPTRAGLLPISGVQKQKSCSYSLTPSLWGVAGAHSKSMTPSSLMAILSSRFMRGSSYTEMDWPWFSRATYLSSEDHLKAGHGNLGAGLGGALGSLEEGMSRFAKDRRGLEVSRSQMT